MMSLLLARTAAIVFAATVLAMVAALVAFDGGFGTGAAFLVAGLAAAIALPALGAWVVGPVVGALDRLVGDLDRKAEFDGATGLPNRMLLHDRLRLETARAMRAGTGYGVMCVLLDGLAPPPGTASAVTGGGAGVAAHERTDAVRRALARSMAASMRASDTVARLDADADVYVVVLADQAGPETCAVGAARLHAGLAAAVAGLPGGREVADGLRVDIGIACYPVHGRVPEDLVELSEVAARQAAGEAAAEANATEAGGQRWRFATPQDPPVTAGTVARLSAGSPADLPSEPPSADGLQLSLL